MECVQASPVVVRPADVQDIFIRGIHDIEDLGDCARFVLYADIAPVEAQGPVEHRIRAQIVMQLEDVPSAVRMTIAFIIRKLKQRTASCPFIRLLH